MSSVDVRRPAPFEETIQRGCPVECPDPTPRMAMAMAWGLTISLMMWAGFLAVIL